MSRSLPQKSKPSFGHFYDAFKILQNYYDIFDIDILLQDMCAYI